MAVRIGTSGWTYPHWQKSFFPPECPSAERLRYYARKFPTVEINTTFYGLPKPAVVRHWRAAVPKRFRFAVKASRYITHLKRLQEPKPGLAKLFRAIRPLAPQIAAILFQLPPGFARDDDRLRAFLKQLPREYRHVFEFRHESWFCAEVYALLRAFKAALCIYDLKGFVSPKEVTAPLVYLRLHGPTRAAYRGSYPDALLRQWKADILRWKRARREVLVYFDNDEKGYAPLNARRLIELLD